MKRPLKISGSKDHFHKFFSLKCLWVEQNAQNVHEKVIRKIAGSNSLKRCTVMWLVFSSDTGISGL